MEITITVDLRIFCLCILVGSLFDSCRSRIGKIEECVDFNMDRVRDEDEVCIANRDKIQLIKLCVAEREKRESVTTVSCIIDWNKLDYFEIVKFMAANKFKWKSLHRCYVPLLFPGSKLPIECTRENLNPCKANTLEKFFAEKDVKRSFCKDSKSQKWTPDFLFYGKDAQSYCRIPNPKSVTQPTYDKAPNCDLSEIGGKLKLVSKPSWPLDPKVYDINADRAQLRWGTPLDDGGFPITGYYVEKKNMKSKAWRKVGHTEDVYISVTKLTEGGRYNLRVRAENKEGLSVASYIIAPFIARSPINKNIFDCRDEKKECKNGGRCEKGKVFHSCLCTFPFYGERCQEEQLSAPKCGSKTCEKGTCTKINKVGLTIVTQNDFMTYAEDDYFCMCEQGHRGKACEKKCRKGTYGKLCSNICSIYCRSDEECDTKDGKCPCKSGSNAYGSKCSKYSCEKKTDCNGAKCLIGAGRDERLYVYNLCDCSSILGVTGPHCNQTCTGNKFGAGCKKKCGHCVELPCDPQTGTCPKRGSAEARCRGAYEPPLCKSRPIGAIISSLVGRFRMTAGETSTKRKKRKVAGETSTRPKKRKVENELEEKITDILSGLPSSPPPVVRVETAYLTRRIRRQSPQSTQTALEVSFTAEFRAEDVNDANLGQEVMSLLKKNSGKLQSDLLPGMSVDKSSISVSQVRTVTVGGDSSFFGSNASWKYVALVLCGFFVLVLGALVAVIMRTRKKSGQPNPRKQPSWIPPGNTRMIRSMSQRQSTKHPVYYPY